MVNKTNCLPIIETQGIKFLPTHFASSCWLDISKKFVEGDDLNRRMQLGYAANNAESMAETVYGEEPPKFTLTGDQVSNVRCSKQRVPSKASAQEKPNQLTFVSCSFIEALSPVVIFLSHFFLELECFCLSEILLAWNCVASHVFIEKNLEYFSRLIIHESLINLFYLFMCTLVKKFIEINRANIFHHSRVSFHIC